MTDESQEALERGIDGAAPESARDRADIKRWFERFDQARKFDDDARKQYAKDRRYARGDSGFEVDANVIGTNIDILEAFLYAKNPDVDVVPAIAVEPPDQDAITEAADRAVSTDPQLDQMGAMAIANGFPPEQINALKEQAVQQQAGQMQAQIRDRYDRRMRDAKAYAETIEIIVSRLWRDAALKRRGRQWVRAALTVGVGWMKASWQERTAPSPATTQQIHDLQSEIKRLEVLTQEERKATGDDQAAILAEKRRVLASLQAQQQPVVARGFVIDQPSGEDVQVAPGVPIADYLDAPWIAHIVMLPAKDAQAECGLTKEELGKCDKFRPRKPVMGKDTTPAVDGTITAEDASAFVPGTQGESGAEYVMLVEFWDAASGTVLTGIKGLCSRWAKPAWQPQPTERFYPFFLLPLNEVDGQRHPQSLVSRSAKLADEYNRIGTAEREHRKRCMPQIIFDAGQLKPEDAKKLAGGTAGEWIPVDLTGNQRTINDIAKEKPYPKIDPMLYDRNRIIGELERIWGVQEALSGSIDTAKTATEAEIQQSGFNARTGGRRDIMESVLGELAQYTAEVARAHVSIEDARAMAGQDAFWPEYSGADDLRSFVNVDIRAGSSGKPNTSAERAAWAAVFPTLQSTVMQVAQLRNSSPEDIAESLIELARLTAQRSGDERIDINQLMPKPGPAPVMPMPSGVINGPEQGKPAGPGPAGLPVAT